MSVTRCVYNLALIGFGNVGRTFVSLLERKRAELGTRYNIEFLISGIASRRLGWLVHPSGFEPKRVLAGDFADALRVESLRGWILESRPDAVFETSSLNPQTGQPAIEHVRCALEHGAHAISANKGPVVHGYQELTDLAKRMHRKFYFESSVMDGAPVFNLFRECLPAIDVTGFRGILNSTTNVILERMEQGESFDGAVKYCQEIGVAETDPSNDIEGWDGAVKVAALATVLLRHPLKPSEVERGGIGEITAEQIRSAKLQGQRFKVVCGAKREGERLRARVAPELLPIGDPLAQVIGTSSLITFETDVLPGLAIHEINPGLDAVAYGLLTDFLRAVKE